MSVRRIESFMTRRLCEPISRHKLPLGLASHHCFYMSSCNNLFYSGTCADAFTGVEGVSKALGAVSGITEDLSKQRAIIPESSIHLFPLLRITPSFPPTLLFHGERDVAIPISDSEVFDSELKRNGVPSRFIRVEGEGSGHGFDRQDFGHWYEKDLRDNTLWLFSQV